MALSANTVWEVRGGAGSDNNGGGFVAGASGVDRSQQDAAFASGTNLTVDASTNTDVTPDGHTVSADDVGNIIQITAGAGFTQGFYQIVSIQGGTKWRLDRSPAATSTSGGTWAMGGALATIAKAAGAVVDGNTVYVKATATYTLTAFVTLAISRAHWIGYSSARTDWESTSITGRPTITTSTNSTHLFRFSTNQSDFQMSNFIFTNTASTRDHCFGQTTAIGLRNATFRKCRWDGFTGVVNVTELGAGVWHRCEIENCTSHGLTIIDNGARGAVIFDACFIHDNGGWGINKGAAFALVLINCIFARNANGGVTASLGSTGASAVSFVADRCVFDDNTGPGLQLGTGGTSHDPVLLTNNIFYDNTTYGVNFSAAASPVNVSGYGNAYGANATAARNNVPTLPGDVTLSADPFTARGSDDYTLNDTSGGGADLKGVGFPVTIP